MNLKLSLVAISLISLVGCSQFNKPETVKPQQIEAYKQAYAVDLADYPEVNTNFDMEYDYQYDAVEKYGSISYKVVGACFQKYESMLDGIDTSTEYGDAVLTDFQTNNKKCVIHTLKGYPEIAPEDRQKVTHFNNELDMTAKEADQFNETEIDKYPDVDLSQEAPEDFSYADHLKQVTAMCEDNNPGDQDAVEICIKQSS